MFSPVILKTWIGSPLSMQSDSAVVSIASSSSWIASRCVSRGMNVALGSFSGSAV